MQKQSVNSFTLDEEYLLQNKDNSSQQTVISSINMFTVWYVLSISWQIVLAGLKSWRW